MDPKIKSEFHALIPPISKEEYSLLEESLIDEGCREALVTWNDYILDGHNRFEICQKHDIRFKTIEKSFENEGEAKIWIIRNQLARRNLPPHERARLVLLLKPVIEEKIRNKEHQRKTTSQKSDESPMRTDEEVAKLAGVSKDTVRKVEVIEKEAAPEVKEAVRKGEISVNKAYKATRKKDSKGVSSAVIEQKIKEPKALFQLKKWWLVTSKGIQKRFIVWVKERGEL